MTGESFDQLVRHTISTQDSNSLQYFASFLKFISVQMNSARDCRCKQIL